MSYVVRSGRRHFRLLLSSLNQWATSIDTLGRKVITAMAPLAGSYGTIFLLGSGMIEFPNAFSGIHPLQW